MKNIMVFVEARNMCLVSKRSAWGDENTDLSNVAELIRDFYLKFFRFPSFEVWTRMSREVKGCSTVSKRS